MNCNENAALAQYTDCMERVDKLANTGFDAWWLLVAGVVLISIGLLIYAWLPKKDEDNTGLPGGGNENF